MRPVLKAYDVLFNEISVCPRKTIILFAIYKHSCKSQCSTIYISYNYNADISLGSLAFVLRNCTTESMVLVLLSHSRRWVLSTSQNMVKTSLMKEARPLGEVSNSDSGVFVGLIRTRRVSEVFGTGKKLHQNSSFIFCDPHQL